MPLQPMVIRSEPGIKRDGTKFEGNNYVDGQWVRFQRGLPRKMGGYRRLVEGDGGYIRGMHINSHDGLTFVHVGNASGVYRFTLNDNAVPTATINRTDPSYVSDLASLWTFDAGWCTVCDDVMILAHVAKNLPDISNDTDGELYYGFNNGTDNLQLIPDVTVSGGIVVLEPYVFAYGTDGFIQWSRPGFVTDWTGSGSGSARITNQKIVKGLPLRAGAGSAPAGLFWSLNALIRASFVGGQPVFQFDTISSQSSILSSQSVIEYDGLYFWCGVDRFLMFNGVVREVPNSLNLNWFYDNLNYNAREKIFAVKVPRWGEIWWCFPFGNATECTHAVVYNVRENTWYDTILPDSGRSAGQYAQVFSFPLMAATPVATDIGNRVTEDGDNRITEDDDNRVINDPIVWGMWQHEFGADRIAGTEVGPVRSYFETADISLIASDNPQNMAMRVEYIEPDFVQSGDMTVRVTGRANAKAADVESQPQTIFATPSTPQEQLVYFREIRREMRFIFESNTLNGDYQMGQVVAHVEPATGTVLGEVAS
jgi:hypothetical protein